MSYRELVRSSGPLFPLLGLAARLPYAMLPLATLLWLRAGGVSFTQAGVVAAGQSVAIAVGGLVAGRLADRHGPRRVGAVAAVLNAAATAVMLLIAPHGWPALAAATLAGLTQPQVGPLVRVHWSLARPDLLPVALSFEAAVDEISFILGPVLASLPVTLVLLLAAALPFALRYDSRGPAAARGSGRIGWPPVIRLVLAMACVGSIFGVVQTGVTAHGGAGPLYALLGVGSGLGGIVSGWLRPSRRMSAAGLTAGMVVVAMGGFGLVPLPFAMLLGGATIAPFMVSLFVAAERFAAGHVGTVIAVLSAGGPVGTAAGQVVAGRLADLHGAAGPFALAPVAALICVVV
jgi:predicted MFS family arabinose efflux permease